MLFLTLETPKNPITHSRFEIDPKLDLELLRAANRMKQRAIEHLLKHPNLPINWFEIQGWIEIEVMDLKNQICKQNAFLSLQELEDLAWKTYLLSVLAKDLLTSSKGLAA